MKRISVARIQAEVAAEFRIPAEKMIEPLGCGKGKDFRNSWTYSRPRQVAMYLARMLTDYSLPSIGHLFGGRDHSTVFHAVRTVEQRMESDDALRLRVEELEKRIESGDGSAPPLCIAEPVESLDCSMSHEIPKHVLAFRLREEAEEARFRATYHALMSGMMFEPKVRQEDRVYRDPCIKCGVRGDIGCVHTRVAA